MSSSNSHNNLHDSCYHAGLQRGSRAGGRAAGLGWGRLWGQSRGAYARFQPSALPARGVSVWAGAGQKDGHAALCGVQMQRDLCDNCNKTPSGQDPFQVGGLAAFTQDGTQLRLRSCRS